MYHIKRQTKKWIKDHKRKGYSLSKKCVWCERHSPSRQSKKSHHNKRK